METRWLRLSPRGPVEKLSLPVECEIEGRFHQKEPWSRLVLRGRLILENGSGIPLIKVHPRHMDSQIERCLAPRHRKEWDAARKAVTHLMYGNDWRLHALAPFLHQSIVLSWTTRLGEVKPGVMVELKERLAGYGGYGLHALILWGGGTPQYPIPVKAWGVASFRYFRVFPTMEAAMRIFRSLSGCCPAHHGRTNDVVRASATHSTKERQTMKANARLSSSQDQGMTQDEMDDLGIEEAPTEIVEDMMAEGASVDDEHGGAS